MLQALAASGAIAASPGCTRSIEDDPGVEDISQLDRIPVLKIQRPSSTSGIQQALADSRGPVSVGGARCSMGGQIASENSVHFDMRAMKRLVWFDPVGRKVRVQAGMSWRDLQDIIDARDLSVKVMQSYSNFTVGGSVSVNCHGRYVGKGPIINSVRALQVVVADGEVVELSRHSNPELFRAVAGGYGGLGIITEVELDLDENSRIRREARRIDLEEYPSFFAGQILSNPDVVLHNADLAPPRFDAPISVSWLKTDAALTEPRRLVPRHFDYDREQNLIWATTELPGGTRIRDKYLTDKVLQEKVVTWRNHEASLDTASLEPRTRFFSTYLLQEYFIPVKNFARFARALFGVLSAHAVNALNVSIRHSPADLESLLTWAPTEVFSFVIYYKQRSTDAADRLATRWTRHLIDAALENDGRYYLPYRLHATTAQFARAYPEARQFAALKRKVDPTNRFHNKLWDKYLPSSTS